MDIIKLEASENGYRPAIQSDWVGEIPPGYIEVPEGTDTSAMQEYGGFVELNIDEDGILTDITGNKEAYQAYLDSLPPEPVPEPTEAQILGREITDLQLEQISQGQWITELELNQMEGGTPNA